MNKTQPVVTKNYKSFWLIFGVMALVYIIIAAYFNKDFLKYFVPRGGDQGFYILTYYTLPLLFLFGYWLIIYFRKKFNLNFILYFFAVQVIAIFWIMIMTVFKYTDEIDDSSLLSAIIFLYFLMFADMVLLVLSHKKRLVKSIIILFIVLFLLTMFIMGSSVGSF